MSDFTKIVFLALLFAPSLVLLSAQSVQATQAKPPTDSSFYMTTSDTTTAYNLGYSQGVFDHNNGNANSEVVIDFGGQLSNGSGTLMTNGVTITNAQIEAVAEQFSQGYYDGTGADTTSVLILAVGTNNSYYDVSSGGGATWDSLIQQVLSWNSAHGPSAQVAAATANDIESFSGANTPSATIAWLNGYYNFGSAPAMFDYGSADGCPQTTHTNGGCSWGWNQYDYWYVSWGETVAYADPEIYTTNGTQAAEWTQISYYGSVYYSRRIYFSGPLDEYDLNTGSNTSTQAWNQLWNDINYYSATASNMNWSLEIHRES